MTLRNCPGIATGSSNGRAGHRGHTYAAEPTPPKRLRRPEAAAKAGLVLRSTANGGSAASQGRESGPDGRRPEESTEILVV